MKDTMQLRIPAISANELFARDTVAAFCVRLNPTVDELSDVKTAVSEAVTNCIVHAYAKEGGEILIECIADGDTLHISIADSGRGIEDIVQAMEPFFTTLEEEERSGMGFTIMQTFMTTFCLESKPGRGTTVKMSKRFGDLSGAGKLSVVGERAEKRCERDAR